ncbi:MAG: hypothetical protein IGS39_20290 [Calothrix sp. C42_A2020_038]|nr:hypothetical protein [Calothrix sp. C42_A2020_038]
MLKKSFAFGVLAVMAMAPAAFADQVQGNTSSTQITTGNVGTGNVSGINNSTYTGQFQGKTSSPFCVTGNQVQGNVANTGISAGNVGLGNVSGISNSTGTTQSQNANCAFPYFR